MGIRYVVTASGDLPREAARRLGQQLDLVVVQGAGGMTVYRNTESLPEAWALPGERAQAVTRSAGLTAAAALPREGLVSLDRESATAWTGSVALPEAGVVLAGTEYGRRWRLKWEPGSESLPFRAFGWGLGFDAAAGDSRILVSFEGQAARSIQVGALVALWAAALWATRRRPDPTPPSPLVTEKAPR
jgi:hypothetical protein